MMKHTSSSALYKNILPIQNDTDTHLLNIPQNPS